MNGFGTNGNRNGPHPDSPPPHSPPPLRASVDPARLFSVEGLVAVVTGGGTGIGLMIATALENNGATVYIVGRRKDVLERAVRERSRHGKMHAHACDLASRDAVLALVATVRAAHGYLDLLINNAGVSPGLRTPAPASAAAAAAPSVTALQDALWATPPEDFARAFEVNVGAAYYTTVGFLELLHAGNLRRAGAGAGAHDPTAGTSQVITVSSGAAFRRDEGQFSFPYALSKGAGTHLAKTFVGLFRECKIRSNVIVPGIYPSEMTAFMSDATVKQGAPLGRAGSEEDMAGMVLFLASRAGAYCNGTINLTDGGRLSMFPSTY
ncbi:hypothetical protein OF83DRAFT_1052072 [Amylostereum chailletii]|nr:hypothetical protein OF83DRAFT_1052072 [Amylostereum chailletii]